jgi:hypothetical protein
MVYKVNLFFHAKSIHEFLPRFGEDAVAVVGLRTFRLEVRARNRFYYFTPQFVYREEGRIRYTPNPEPRTRGFIGWLPYFNKRWPIATDKLAFKAYCVANGVRTPQFWRSASGSVKNFIIKQSNSSFAYGIRGPFRVIEGGPTELKPQDAEYYEAFVPGTIAKAWYWDGELVCLEMREMPTVSGSGKDSLYVLICAKAPSAAPPDRGEFEALVRFQGYSLDNVLEPGKSVLADFRYGSSLFPTSLENANVLPDYRGTEVERQLSEAGAACWKGIPEELRASTLFTLDAVVDDAKQVWFLEMNCNPMVHPDTYLPMFESLFGRAAEPAPPPPEAEPRPADAPPLLEPVGVRHATGKCRPEIDLTRA